MGQVSQRNDLGLTSCISLCFISQCLFKPFVQTGRVSPVKQGAHPAWGVGQAPIIWSQLNQVSVTHIALVRVITIHWKPLTWCFYAHCSVQRMLIWYPWDDVTQRCCLTSITTSSLKKKLNRNKISMGLSCIFTKKNASQDSCPNPLAPIHTSQTPSSTLFQFPFACS